MQHIKEKAYWRLTISFWPKATEAGVRPCLTPKPFLMDEEFLPNYYDPTDIDFANPPTREDFLQICRQTPWMVCFEKKGLLAVIADNDWPMIDPVHKGSTVELLNEDGEVCGELRVRRQYYKLNQSYVVPIISSKMWDNITCRLEKKPDIMLQSKSENRIQERMLNAKDHSDERMKYEMRLVLHEEGFLKSKPKLPKKAA